MVDLDAWVPFEGHIAGAEFSGRRFDWKTGFYVRSAEGLLSGGRVTRRALARPGGPGALYTKGRRDTERGILIDGFAYAGSQGELQALHEQFIGILPNEEDFDVLSFRELGPWRHVTVSRSTVSEFGRANANRFAQYQLVLSAPDQRVYGDPLETTGWGQSVTVTNRGTHRAPVTIKARRAGSTNVAGYTITGPGGSVVTTQTLTSTQHEYSGDDGILLAGTTDVSESLTRADSLEVPHGSHTFTVSAGVEILVAGSDTYIP